MLLFACSVVRLVSTRQKIMARLEVRTTKRLAKTSPVGLFLFARERFDSVGEPVVVTAFGPTHAQILRCLMFTLVLLYGA
ncbi:hypothetical protein M3J09_002607 [Ascochyta lentis]